MIMLSQGYSKNLLVLGRIGGYGMCFCVLSSVRLQAVSDPATRWKYQLKLLKKQQPDRVIILGGEGSMIKYSC